MSVGLTVIVLGGSRLTAARESCRRTAASVIHDNGDSGVGAFGAVPANGFNISLTRVARAVATLGAGFAAFGVAGCVVTIALGVTRELRAVDTDDNLEVLAVCGTTSLGVGSEVAVDGVLTTTSLVAPVPLFVPAGEEAGELGIKPVRLDDDRSLLGRGVASAPVVLRVLCVGFWVLAPDDV
jgi:hypothetical protein